MTEVTEETRKVVSVMPDRLKLKEHACNHWRVHAPEGAIPNDVSDPVFWAHIAEKLQSYDFVDVLAHDGQWLLTLIVIDCGRNWAKVNVLETYRLSSVEEDSTQPEKHVVKWGGPKKWCVIRSADNAMINEGLGTKGEAVAWIIEHEKKAA